ncbi:alpha/beta hydrolase [Pseudomonas sp. HR96]|uniref:alpha/beta hydrolase n=1 Tax=Pseudomonas sp. HR96 TaxID=1027966 RepID=UPI002A75670F|nr:alpha/beta hydrolase [Pseudomonas sp. HR96]WPO98990.1 alpha/beta hydrolase [Pseudomonas sp. HR96]
MASQRFTLVTDDSLDLHVHSWLPAASPRAVVLLAHGMADHAGRYAALGAALTAAGYALYAHDQRGHGQTGAAGVPGLFAACDGWRRVVADLSLLRAEIARRLPGTPVVLLGHSMGSYIAQAWLIENASQVAGAVFSGSNYQPASLYHNARHIARFERWRQGPLGRSALIEWLTFGSFNKAFRPNRSGYDWLSRDTEAVDRYIADPLCGFRCTNQLWFDLLGGLAHISTEANLARTRPGLKLLIIGGECDPVSAGKRLTDLGNAWRLSARAQVRTIIYPQARHEVFNELNRAQVVGDLIAWLDTLGATAPTDEPINP